MTDPTPTPCVHCGDLETTRDRHGYNACAACRVASRLLGAALLTTLAELVATRHDCTERRDSA